MKHNVGSVDRIIRIIAGLAIVAAGAYLKQWWGLLGVVFLATAAMSWCPLYLPFGLSTCPKKS